MKTCYPHFPAPYIDVKNYELDYNVCKLIPKEIALEFWVVALEEMNKHLVVVLAYPENEVMIDVLEKKLNRPLLIIKSDFEQIKEAINNIYKQ